MWPFACISSVTMIFDAASPDQSGGHNDHIVDWQRPQRPTWMDAATYATIPETLTIRELRFNADYRGAEIANSFTDVTRRCRQM